MAKQIAAVDHLTLSSAAAYTARNSMSEKILNQIHSEKSGFITKYRQLYVGQCGLLFLCWFEFITCLCGCVPGAFGLALRKVFYPSLFKRCGKGVVFGRSITIRNPKQIEIGNNVIFDDTCVLDAKGEKGIKIGDNVFVSRGVILGCKNGQIHIGSDVTIGPYSTFHSVDASDIAIGNYCIIAGYCYMAGGANYIFAQRDVPIVKQGWSEGKGITLGDDVWIGGSVVIVDGTTIGRGAIVGANSMARGEIAEYAIAHGSPAVKKSERGK